VQHYAVFKALQLELSAAVNVFRESSTTSLQASLQGAVNVLLRRGEELDFAAIYVATSCANPLSSAVPTATEVRRLSPMAFQGCSEAFALVLLGNLAPIEPVSRDACTSIRFRWLSLKIGEAQPVQVHVGELGVMLDGQLLAVVAMGSTHGPIPQSTRTLLEVCVGAKGRLHDFQDSSPHLHEVLVFRVWRNKMH